MSTASSIKGRQITRPPKFSPTLSLVEGGYIYKYDLKRAIGKRSPINPATMGGSVYFEIEVSSRHARQPWQRVLSGAFILMFVAAAFVAAYPWLPELNYQLKKADYQAQAAAISRPAAAEAKTDPAPNVSGNRLLIPKIGVSTAILEGPSLKILDKEEGVWHQTGNTAGNFVLAGHRFKYLPPNTSTLYNLNKLAAGDTIILDWRGRRLVYGVTEIKTVPATQTSILASDPQKPRITVYTCSDKAETKRVAVFAEPVAL